MNDRLSAALADRYRIERELGQGGMATVYLAHDLKHEREVAIKVLREDLSASLGSGRFLREIKIAAQLQHPHILPLLDSGESDGFLYFVMPYIKGQSLRERLAREGELPVHEAVRLLTEVVDALVEAHEHGVVHRDIKPDNVMLSGRHALVTDFGVAKAISEATGRNTVTTLGVAVGTPTYMSPEQAAADPHVDHRSDIYSVGVMAYEMLTGKPPFTGGSPQQVLAAHVTEAPDPVSKRRQAIPPVLEAVVMRCLAKRPADRFQTAAELHAALEPLATPSTGITPTQTRPISAVSEPSRRFRAPARKAAAVAAGLVVLAAILFFVTRGRSGNSGTLVTPITVQATSSGMAEQPSISPDGTRIGYATRKCDATGRCLYDLIVQDIGGAGTLTVASGATAFYDARWSPDGRFLMVFGSWDMKWGVYLVPATVQGPPRFIGCCDGSFLVSADSILLSPLVVPGDSISWLKVLTSADLRVRDSIRVPRPGNSIGVMPAPDGKRIALSITQSTGTVMTRMIRRDGATTDSGRFEYANRAWTSDGTGLLMTKPVAGAIDVFDMMRIRVDGAGRFTGAIDTIWHRASIQDGKFDLTADGGTLAYAQGARQNSIVTLRRADQASVKFTSRVLMTSTAGLGGQLAQDGKQIGIVRILAAGGDHPRLQVSMIPFDSGAEVPASPPLDTLIDWTWTKATSGGIMFSTPQSKGVDRVDGFDLASGRTSKLFALPDSTANLLFTSLSSGVVVTFRPAERQLMVRSSAGVEIRRIKVPKLDALAFMTSSPSGDEVAVVGYDAQTDDSVAIYRVRISDGTVKEVAALRAETFSRFQWLDSGDFLATIGETRQTFALYRIGQKGDLHRLGVLPYPDARYSLARDGLRMVAALSVPHGDVWLVKNFGKMWKK